MRKPQWKKGCKINGIRLARLLGVGGNGEAWEYEDSTGPCVIKILR